MFKIDDTIVSEYYYGAEIQMYKYYKILDIKGEFATLQELEKIIKYDDGKEGPHYYSDPKHSYPTDKLVGKSFKRKIKNMNTNHPTIKTEEYFVSYGPWDGCPMEEFNFH